MFFQHDNARPHVAKRVKEKLEELGWTVLKHPPYSPDLAPSDYHLFRSMQNALLHKKFRNEEEVREFLSEFFASKPKEFYARGINQLPSRCQKVIDSNGEYIDD